MNKKVTDHLIDKIAELRRENDRLTQDLEHCRDCYQECATKLLKEHHKTEGLWLKLSRYL